MTISSEELSLAQGEKIARESCILELHIRQPGFRVKMNSRQFLSRSGNNQHISDDVLYVSKDLIQRDDIKYLETHRSEFLKTIKSFSIPSGSLTLGNGQYLMPLESVPNLQQLIKDFQAKRVELIDKFEQEYETLKEKMRLKLGGFFNAWEYPQFNMIRAKYRLDYRFHSNSIPENFKRLQEHVRLQEQVRSKKELAQQAEEIITLMRQGYVAILDDLLAKLGRDPESGKFKSLPEARIIALLEFINTFDAKNILKDENLKVQVDKAKEALEGISIRDIRKDESIRERLDETLTEIKEETKPLLITRRMDLSHLK